MQAWLLAHPLATVLEVKVPLHASLPHDACNIWRVQDIATAAFSDKKYAEAGGKYAVCERQCTWVLANAALDSATAEEIQRQLSLCKLNRSLCLQRSNEFNEAYTCATHVVNDAVSTPTIKCKAAIRAGQCLVSLAAAEGNDTSKQHLLAQAQAAADRAATLAAGLECGA